MADSPTRLDLPDVEAEQLSAAVRSVLAHQSAAMPDTAVDPNALIGRLPSAARLRAGAAESVKDEVADAAAAEYFQTLLELGYLAASADGLAAEEREALALLVEHATDAVVDREVLRLHFSDLDASTEMLGRRERLARMAANLETEPARQEAMGFATLVAIADGTLEKTEMEVLLELGRHFSMSAEQVQAVIDSVAANIKQELEG